LALAVVSATTALRLSAATEALTTLSAVDCLLLFPVLRTTTSVPAATTSTVAAMRHTIGSIRFRGLAAGITPRGALSRAVRIRDEAAMNPRASATAA
jgi:hypothetical protein